MNKEIATILKTRISMLPFIDVLAGLVQTVETEDFMDGALTKLKRFPVSYDVQDASTCLGRERDLQPDSSKKSITYFEDFGTVPLSVRGNIANYASSLRLVCWLNRKKLVGDDYAEISATCISMMLKKLTPVNPFNAGMFTRMHVKATRIPEQSSALFARYTYDEKVRQYLRPPFECFGIDLTCSYQINTSCMDPIDFTINKNC